MTPIECQEPSRIGTPARDTTPVRSPISGFRYTVGKSEPGLAKRRKMRMLLPRLKLHPLHSWLKLALTHVPQHERRLRKPRFKREELKIASMENHQRAKAEAKMKKMEVEVERMRGRAQDKLTSKLASVQGKAQEKRANAETKRTREAVKTEQRVDYIQKTERIPPGCPCCW